jgi:hypothetical protein
MAALECLMAGTHLSKAKRAHMMKPKVLEVGVNLMQFCGNFSHIVVWVVWGPIDLKGLDVKDPYLTQGLTWLLQNDQKRAPAVECGAHVTGIRNWETTFSQ